MRRKLFHGIYQQLTPASFCGFFGDGFALGRCETGGSGFATLQSAHATERHGCGVFLRLVFGFLSDLINDGLGETVYVCA